MPFKNIITMFQRPRIQIDLMLEKTVSNHPFYAEAVRRFYKVTRTLHPKLLFAARKYEYGYALCELPQSFDTYFMKLDSSARRNYRKAVRGGYQFKRFDFNSALNDIREIWMSTPVRQGVLPKDMREGRIQPISDPPSHTHYQDYPYFGIFKNDKLVAYAACLVAGELCSLNDLYGHAHYQEDAVVPMLLIEIAREMLQTYPNVKYYGYGTYFGASPTMRRFKRKFLFYPHRVSWVLGKRSNSELVKEGQVQIPSSTS